MSPSVTATVGSGMTPTVTLADVAATYRACLPPGSLGELRIDPLDRTGIPVVAADWSGPGQPPFSSFGYGTTPEQATVGALGEMAESVLVTAHLARLPRRTATYADLVTELGAERVADPLTLTLPAGGAWSPETSLQWLAMTRWRTGEQVWVPAEFVACRPGDLPGDGPPGGWLTTPVTNGLGAGDSVERALSHALLELVQRDGNTVSLRALEQGTLVDCAAIGDPSVRAVLDGLAGVGLVPQVRLASTEFAVVVHVTARDTDPGAPALAVTGCGEGAHPDREVAIAKAAQEFAASRVRKVFAHGSLDAVRALDAAYLDRELARSLPQQEQRSLQELAAWSRLSAPDLTRLLDPVVLAERRTVPVDDLPTVPTGSVEDPRALLALVLARLADFDVLVLPVTATGPAGEQVTVVKALVPGLEVETLSYLRIGERVLRRLLDRDSPLVGLGPAGGTRLEVRLPADATARVGGPAWLDEAVVAATVGPLYPLYREPTRHAVPRLAG